VLLVGTSEWLTQFKATLNTRTDATVKRVETKSEALEVFRRESTDCLITEYALAETTGLDLLRDPHRNYCISSASWYCIRERSYRQRGY